MAHREQAADVGAGNRQQRNHRGEPEPHAALRLFADDIVEEWRDAHVQVLVALVGFAESSGDQPHFRPRFIDRPVWGQTPDDLERITVTLEA